ncbi:hypothetical protein LMH87_005912 [Akanthomyces muscarius]|uniref:Uncharacterized protein n=1 Tax=Akanthomyces muscarius TaxID=2231603 RepID=A0A9W8USM3_AKAMU|nr:hypothetical protein LMH87_005912 [Akanthomyces muscarius]KAJ4164229.1 hypothetical protein LMH87_005912 [Akanthomyces muscarius]
MIETTPLYTAGTGDSGVVLGRRTSGDEQAIIRNGRRLGFAATRVFEDIRWKSSCDTQWEFGKRFFMGGSMSKDENLTPSYLTAKPVITVSRLEDELTSILILATDVAQLHEYGGGGSCGEMAGSPVGEHYQGDEHEAANGADYCLVEERAPEGGKLCSGFDFLERWNNVDVRFPEERATIEDSNNIAVYLLRNAFGGNHRELLTGRLVYQAPVSKNKSAKTKPQNAVTILGAPCLRFSPSRLISAFRLFEEKCAMELGSSRALLQILVSAKDCPTR